jgi:galactokinase
VAAASLLGDLARPEAGISRECLLEAVEALPDVLADMRAVREALQCGEQEAVELLRPRSGDLLPVPAGGFKIRPRARHVFTEALRVEQAVRSTNPDEFSRLMNESHVSCARDYEVSCEELDALVEVARKSGAWGARLTGAGFGGSVVALVPDHHTHSFRSLVAEGYYGDWLPYHRPKIRVPEDLSAVLFECKASAGASVSAVANLV